MSKQVTVVLYGTDGAEHARGELPTEVIATAAIVVRNARHYVYGRLTDNTISMFEVKPPYILTEF